MKIFGKEFVTKKQLKQRVADLEAALDNTINDVLGTFPFRLGQVVYDIQLRNESGKYTKKNASREHSRINEVEVTKKNYFSLVDRYNNNDVFFTQETAEAYLNRVCVKK
jgi:hypothetical protein